MIRVIIRMKICDIDFDFFSRMQRLAAADYQSIFGNIDPANIDDRTKRLYGSRQLFTSMIDDGKLSDSGVVGICLAYDFKWMQYKKLLENDADFVTNPYQMNTTHSATSDSTVTDSSNDTDMNDMYAFDSTDSVHDSKKTNESSTSENRNSESSNTTNVSGNKGNMTYADIARSQIRLIQMRTIDTIISDVIGELTLSVYE